MGETSTQDPRATDITPGIEPNKLKKGIVRNLDRYAEADDPKPSEEFVVRLKKNQASVSLTLNTKRMVERRETERVNEIKRRSGR
jgi:hypothetical protein